MKVRELIEELDNEKILDKEVVLEYPNENIGPPAVKFVLKDKYQPFNFSKENIEKVILTW